MTIEIVEDEYLTRKEAARFLRSLGIIMAPRTLANLAITKSGPPYVKSSAKSYAAYPKTGLRQWAAARRIFVAA